MDNKVSWVDGLPYINLNWTENESCSNHYDIYNIVDKEISSTNPNRTENESYSNIHDIMGKKFFL